MLAADARQTEKPLEGSPLPRLAPPRPLKTTKAALIEEAACLGITFMPWQDTAATYIEAVDASGRWLYPEVGEIVGRQNGKTEILIPHVCRRLRMGRRIMHTAQNRELPREVFGRVADHMVAKHRDELAARPRFANGQEEIKLTNGGRYRIVAPTRGGARGPSNDDLLIDEIREMEGHDFIAAAKPTLSASPNPQTLYSSNAGTAESAVLNALRERADTDPSLAYLEWSAAPDLPADDIRGWLASNPAIGHLPQKYENLEREYRANQLGRTMEVFETEYLCRWTTSLEERLVSDDAWAAQEFGELGAPSRAVMGLSVDADHERASIVIAWADRDGKICLDVHDTRVTGQTLEALGKDVLRLGRLSRAWETYYDPYTDEDLARHVPKAQGLRGQRYVTASHTFVRLVKERKFRVRDPDGVLAADLRWTIRRNGGVPGSYMAVRASDEHSNTAALAAIRAAYRASDPSMAAVLQARIS